MVEGVRDSNTEAGCRRESDTGEGIIEFYYLWYDRPTCPPMIVPPTQSRLHSSWQDRLGFSA
jgi:hypothetical protein